MLIVPNDLQLLNAPASIVRVPFGRSNCFKDKQPSNECFPIFIILGGIVMVVKDEHPEKTL